MEPLPTNKTHSELSPIGATGKHGTIEKSHIITLHIVKFPNFTASKPSETISKIKKYEKNQTIPVSHDHLYNRVM